jgi:glutaredoxin
MAKKILWIVGIVLVAAVAIIIFSAKNTKRQEAIVANTNNSTSVDALVFYYGIGCPHCEDVQEYIVNNGLDDKLQINQKEVWYNNENASDLQAKADICKISEDQLGVPIMFDPIASKCYIGEDEITGLLKEKAGI